MNASLPFLQQVLDGIEQALLAGQQHLVGTMAMWFRFFLVLELVWVGLGFVRRHQPGWQACVLVFRTGMVWWLCEHYPSLTTHLLEYMVHLGSLAANHALPSTVFLDAGAYLAYGRAAAQPVHDMVTSSWSLLNPTVALGMLGLYGGFLAAFALCAANVFIWQLEVLVGSHFFLVLLPCLAFRGSAWMAQGALSYLINAGIRFGLLALMAGLIFPIVQQLLTFPARPGLGDMLVIVAEVWAVVLALLYVNRQATALVSGTVALGAGHLVAAATRAVSTAVGVGALGVGATALATGGAFTGLRGVAATANAGRAMLGGTAQMRAGGIGGAVQTFGAAAQGVRSSLASPLSQRMGSFAGSAGTLAASAGRTAGHTALDVTRFVGRHAD